MSRRTRRGAIFGVAAAGIATFVATAVASVGGLQPTGPTAAAKQYDKKVTICHRTGSKRNPFRTIRVSRNAVPAHLRHGDALGPCPTAVFTMCAKAKKGKLATVKVKGARKAQRLMRSGAKLGKCKAKPRKGGDKGKGKDKGRGREKGRGGEKGKGRERGKGGEKGKGQDKPPRKK